MHSKLPKTSRIVRSAIDRLTHALARSVTSWEKDVMLGKEYSNRDAVLDQEKNTRDAMIGHTYRRREAMLKKHRILNRMDNHSSTN